MSKEKAVLFLNRLKNDGQLAGTLKDRENPAGEEDLCRICSEIAAECGEDIPPEAFLEALRDSEEELRQRTDSAVSDMEALHDSELDDVSGGSSSFMLDGAWYNGCRHTHDGWCVAHDACNWDNVNYLCDENYNDTNCDFTNYCDGSFITYTGYATGDARSDLDADAMSSDFMEGRISGADFF